MDICEGKIKEMQKYVPFLGKLIENLKKDKSNIAKLSQMQLLYNLLTKPDKGITLNTLIKCEEVLEKVFGTNKNKEIDKPHMSSHKKETDSTQNRKDVAEKKEKSNSKSALVNNGSKEAKVSSDKEDSQVSEDTSKNRGTPVDDPSPECFSKENKKVEHNEKTETPAEKEIVVDKEEDKQEISHSPAAERDAEVSNTKNKKECSDEDETNKTTLPEDETKVTPIKEVEDNETTVEDMAETTQESNESASLDDGTPDDNLEDIKKKQENVQMDIDDEDVEDKQELEEKCSNDDEGEVVEEAADKIKEKDEKMVIDEDRIDKEKCPDEEEVIEATKAAGEKEDIKKTEKVKMVMEEECIDKEEYADEEEEEAKETVDKEDAKKTNEKVKLIVDEEAIDKEVRLDEEEELEETINKKDIKQPEERVQMVIDEECIDKEECSEDEEEEAKETVGKEEAKKANEKVKLVVDEESIDKEERPDEEKELEETIDKKDIKQPEKEVKMVIDEECIDKEEYSEGEEEEAKETVGKEDAKKTNEKVKLVVDEESIDKVVRPDEEDELEETIDKKDIKQPEQEVKMVIDEECIDKEEYSGNEEEKAKETVGKEDAKKTNEKVKLVVDEESIDKEEIPDEEETEEAIDEKDIKQPEEKVKMEIDEECIGNEGHSREKETVDKEDIKQSKEKVKMEIDEECIVKEEIKEECPDDEEEEQEIAEETVDKKEEMEDNLELPKNKIIDNKSRLDEDKVHEEKEVNNLKTNNCKVIKNKSVTPTKELSNSKENDILPLSDDDDNLLVPLPNAVKVDDYDIVEEDPPKSVKNKLSPTKPNKSDIFNDSIDSKNHSPDELSKLKLSENDSIKKIELKPKGPSDKPAVVYFIKKNNNPPKQQQPVETIELLESDSDDDDVILVSEVGLKKKPPPKIIMVPKGTRLVPRPKSMLQQQLQQKTQLRVLNKSAPCNTRTNQPMFAIASVESISQRVNNVKTTPIKAPNTSNNITNQKKQSPKSTPPAKPASRVINSYSKQVSTDTSVDCSINGSPENETNKDIYMNKEWLENFLTNLLSPTQIKSSHAMDMLQAVLDRKTFDQIKDIVQLHDECASEDSDIEIDKNTEAIREIFIKKGIMTEVGKQLCSLASQDGSSVFTTDRRNGQVTSKSRKSKNKPNNDDEYAPNVMLCLDEEVVSERRRSLRRESKLNRKQYFAYDNEDDEEFIRYIDEQARIQSNNNKKKKAQKRPPPSSASDNKDTKTKKQRLRKGASIETFETELLTPTWVEDSALYDVDGRPSQSTIGNDDDYEEQQLTNERSSRFHGNINPDFGGDDDDEDDDADTDRKPKIIDETSRHTKAPIWPFKNINRIYHCRSDYVDTCLICNTKIQFVVSHYVNQHRESEVIIARLTKKDVDFLVRNVNHGFLSTQRNTNHIYASTCIFCKRNMSFALRYWWEHYTMHTGEYGYECNKCFLRRPRRQHAQKHANDCRVGTGESVVKIVYDFDKKTNKIEAYICKLCNFIQLHRDNLVKHLETQHEFTTVPEIAENMIKVVLLQISRPYSDPAILTNETFQDMANEIAAAYPGLDQNSIDLQSQFMQYTDDLSFAICDMLAADDDGDGEIVTGDQIAASQQQETSEVIDE